MQTVRVKSVKFATQLDEHVAKELRSFAAETDRSISKIVNEAVTEYLARYRVRPAFRSAIDEIIADHGELLERLAR